MEEYFLGQNTVIVRCGFAIAAEVEAQRHSGRS